MSVDVNETKLKETKNLFNSLIKDENSIFYSVDRTNKNLLCKARRLLYAKDKVFIKLNNEIDNKIDLYVDNHKCSNLPLTTPFVEKRKNIDHSILYSFKEPF